MTTDTHKAPTGHPQGTHISLVVPDHILNELQTKSSTDQLTPAEQLMWDVLPA